jgi:non-specific serine/threonine protein kinase
VGRAGRRRGARHRSNDLRRRRPGRPRPTGRLTLWLPGDAANPWPSPRIAAAPPHGDAVSAGVEPWTVPTLAVDPGSAIHLFLAGTGRSEEALGDASLDYLAAAVLFALELAARGRFLPGFVPTRDGRGFEARWLPVPGATDTERLQALARALPPSCRAEAGSLDRRGRGSVDVLAQMLTDVVDSVARAGVGPRAFPRAAARTKHAAPLDAVLDALAAASPTVLPDSPEFGALAGTVTAWHRRAATGDAGFRTCFRVIPPDDGAEATEGQGWALEVLLQAADDPSLFVPAADVWKTGRRLAVFGRRIDDPQERLLADLGRASRLHREVRGIFAWHVEEVHSNGPQYRRNKRSGTARWAMIGKDDDGRQLRINILWADQELGILRAIGGWPL